MNNDMKLGAGVVALMALCCGGPLILSLLASGAVLGALGGVWAGGRLLLLVGGAALVLAAVWLLVRRRAPGTADGVDCCAAPADTADQYFAASQRPSVGREQVPLESGGRRTSR
jgi:hypothetical protein